MRPRSWTGASGLHDLAIDPGLSTGWAEWVDNQPKEQGTITGGLKGFIEFVRSPACRWRKGVPTLIIEDFIVEPDYVGVAWSSEVKGAAIALIPHDRLVIQKRSDKATLFGHRVNGKRVKGQAGETLRFNWLRDRGLAGTAHELDAHTHVLVYEKRQENAELLARYWNL